MVAFLRLVGVVCSSQYGWPPQPVGEPGPLHQESIMPAPRRALVLVDVQQSYFSGALDVQFPPHADSLPQILRAIDAANAAGAPVLAVQHTRGEGAPVFDPSSPAFALHPEVAARRRE